MTFTPPSDFSSDSFTAGTNRALQLARPIEKRGNRPWNAMTALLFMICLAVGLWAAIAGLVWLFLLA